MVQREAVFLISRATEEFVARIAEASQAVASREGRATVQPKDLSTPLFYFVHVNHGQQTGHCPVSCIRRAEEYLFLEGTFRHHSPGMRLYAFLVEAIPLLEPKPAPIKPGKAKDSKATKSGGGDQEDADSLRRQPTMLDQFVQSGKNDMQDSQGEVFENEDGTLSGGGQLEVPT